MIGTLVRRTPMSTAQKTGALERIFQQSLASYKRGEPPKSIAHLDSDLLWAGDRPRLQRDIVVAILQNAKVEPLPKASVLNQDVYKISFDGVKGNLLLKVDYNQANYKTKVATRAVLSHDPQTDPLESAYDLVSFGVGPLDVLLQALNPKLEAPMRYWPCSPVV